MRPARWVFCKRALPAVVAFCAVQVWITRQYQWHISDWIVDRGVAAGCQVFGSRGYLIGEGGPFLGDEPRNARWNFYWQHATLAASSAAGLAAAGALYAIAAGPLGRTRVFGYRGLTRCGRCGYSLAGLAEPRCPECGRSI